jgi:hypothetical protein
MGQENLVTPIVSLAHYFDPGFSLRLTQADNPGGDRRNRREKQNQEQSSC